LCHRDTHSHNITATDQTPGTEKENRETKETPNVITTAPPKRKKEKKKHPCSGDGSLTQLSPHASSTGGKTGVAPHTPPPHRSPVKRGVPSTSVTATTNTEATTTKTKQINTANKANKQTKGLR
jgi:hypothetical protein